MTPKAAGSTFSMTSEAEHLVRLRKWLRDELAGHGVPKQEQPNLLLAVGERIANTSTPGGDRRAPRPCPRDIVCQTRTRNAAGADATAELITDEMLDTYAVTAPYDKLHDKIMERYKGLLDRTSLYQPYQPNVGDPRLPALVKAFNG